MEHGGDSDTSCNWCHWNNPRRIRKGTRRLGNQRTSRDYPNYSIVEIGQNIEKSPGDLRRLAVTTTFGINHWLTLVWKTLKGVNNNKKRSRKIVDFAILADNRVKLKESEKRDTYLNFARELRKTMEHEWDGNNNCSWCT